jgi:DNA-binding transcriptional ArsR family regulator
MSTWVPEAGPVDAREAVVFTHGLPGASLDWRLSLPFGASALLDTLSKPIAHTSLSVLKNLNERDTSPAALIYSSRSFAMLGDHGWLFARADNGRRRERLRPITEINDPRLVKALAHPLRIQILSILEEDAASPSEIADQLGAPLGNVAYHVRALANLGLIKLVRTTPVRGAVEHHYKAQERTRVSDSAWGQVPGIVREAMLDSTIAQIGEYVGAAASAGGFDGEQAHLTRTGLVLDDKGWKELSAALRKFLEKAETIEEASKKRLAGGDHEGEKLTGLVLMLFEAQRMAQVQLTSHKENPALTGKRKPARSRAK